MISAGRADLPVREVVALKDDRRAARRLHGLRANCRVEMGQRAQGTSRCRAGRLSPRLVSYSTGARLGTRGTRFSADPGDYCAGSTESIAYYPAAIAPDRRRGASVQASCLASERTCRGIPAPIRGYR